MSVAVVSLPESEAWRERLANHIGAARAAARTTVEERAAEVAAATEAFVQDVLRPVFSEVAAFLEARGCPAAVDSVGVKSGLRFVTTGGPGIAALRYTVTCAGRFAGVDLRKDGGRDMWLLCEQPFSTLTRADVRRKLLFQLGGHALVGEGA